MWTEVAMNRMRPIMMAAGAVLTLLVGASALATVSTELSLEQLVRQADLVVLGVVTETSTQMVRNQGRIEPNTVVVLDVRRSLKGGKLARVTLHERGGTFKGRTMEVVGTPHYHVGDEVVVFVERRNGPSTFFRTLGMSQGKFDVRRGVPGVPSTVVRDAAGLALVDLGQASAGEIKPDQVMSLTSFLAHIKILVAEE